MAIPIADRVKDATNVIGAANAVLLNTAPAGYVTFFQGFGSSSNKPVCYCISNPNSPYEWETGFGSYTSSTNTLNRVIVAATSVPGSTDKINFPAGIKDVFCTTPSNSMLVQNTNGQVNIPSIIDTSTSFTIAPDLSASGYAASYFSISCPTSTRAAQSGTFIEVAAGSGTTTGAGGYISLSGGSAPGAGLGGDLYLNSGNSVTGSAGIVYILAGSGDAGGGGVDITAGGVSSSGAGSGGNITITSGIAEGSGSNGSISLTLASQPAITIQPADATITAAAKIGLFDATPVVRPTTANTTAGTFVVGSGTALNTNSTYAGGSGNTYTLGQVVAALVKLGILT